MNYGFLLAGGASAFALVLHLLLGRGRGLLPPNEGEEIQRLYALDAWYGRHVTTLVLVAMVTGFGQAARRADASSVGVTLTLLALAIVALRVGLAARTRVPKYDIGEWGLMLLAAGFGVVGMMMGAAK